MFKMRRAMNLIEDEDENEDEVVIKKVENEYWPP
jgi:hypothetical protein